MLVYLLLFIMFLRSFFPHVKGRNTEFRQIGHFRGIRKRNSHGRGPTRSGVFVFVGLFCLFCSLFHC